MKIFKLAKYNKQPHFLDANFMGNPFFTLLDLPDASKKISYTFECNTYSKIDIHFAEKKKLIFVNMIFQHLKNVFLYTSGPGPLQNILYITPFQVFWKINFFFQHQCFFLRIALATRGTLLNMSSMLRY